MHDLGGEDSEMVAPLIAEEDKKERKKNGRLETGV